MYPPFGVGEDEGVDGEGRGVVSRKGRKVQRAIEDVGLCGRALQVAGEAFEDGEVVGGVVAVAGGVSPNCVGAFCREELAEVGVGIGVDTVEVLGVLVFTNACHLAVHTYFGGGVAGGGVAMGISICYSANTA